MVQLSDLTLSPNSDPETMVSQTTILVDDGKWKVCNGGKGLERPFKFKTFKATWVSKFISPSNPRVVMY